MNRKEYTLLLEDWNNFLIKEEKKLIQEQILIESIILNESLIKLAKKFGKKVAFGMLIIKLFELNPNINKYNPHDPTSYKLPAIERISDQAAKTLETHGLDVNNIDPAEAVEAAEENKELQSIGEEDFNDSLEITKALFKVFGDSFEDELEKSDISLMKGIYSKKVYDNWKNNNYKDNEILKNIIRTVKGDFGQKYKTVSLKDNVNVMIYAFKDKSDLNEKIVEYVTNEIILPSIKIKKKENTRKTSRYKKLVDKLTRNPINDEKIYNDIKIFIKDLTKAEITEWLNLPNTNSLGNYWDYKKLQDNINKATSYVYRKVGFELELNELKGGVIGIRVDEQTDEEIMNTLIHEFGHALDQQESSELAYSFIEFLKQSNVMNPNLSVKEVKLPKKKFVEFILSEIRIDFGITAPWVWENFNKSGKKKLLNNVKHLIKYLKGSNIIRVNKDDTIDLMINIYNKGEVYYHILEERIENLGNWTRSIVETASKQGIENPEDIPLNILKNIDSRLKIQFKKDYKKEVNRLVKKHGKSWWWLNGDRIEYSLKSDVLSHIDIDRIFLKACKDLKFTKESYSKLVSPLIKIDKLTTDENIIEEIENLIKILEETNNSLHKHKNHDH